MVVTKNTPEKEIEAPDSENDTVSDSETSSRKKNFLLYAMGVTAIVLLVAGSYFLGRGDNSASFSDNLSGNAPLTSPSPSPSPISSIMPYTTTTPTPTQIPQPTATTQNTSTFTAVTTALYNRNTVALESYMTDTVDFTRFATGYFEERPKAAASQWVMEYLYDDPGWNFDRSNPTNQKIRQEVVGSNSDAVVGYANTNVIVLFINAQNKINAVSTASTDLFVTSP